MSDYRAAYRYAKSLLELSIEQKISETIYNDMVLIDETCDQSRDLAMVLKSPIINHAKKHKILEEVFGSNVSSLTKQFFLLIGRKGRESIFHTITKEFRLLYQQFMGIENVLVTTTFPLDDDLRGQIRKLAKDISKKEPELTENVDEEIVGGFVLDIGSRRIDASIKSKLNKLEKELLK